MTFIFKRQDTNGDPMNIYHVFKKHSDRYPIGVFVFMREELCPDGDFTLYTEADFQDSSDSAFDAGLNEGRTRL